MAPGKQSSQPANYGSRWEPVRIPACVMTGYSLCINAFVKTSTAVNAATLLPANSLTPSPKSTGKLRYTANMDLLSEKKLGTNSAKFPSASHEGIVM